MPTPLQDLATRFRGEIITPEHVCYNSLRLVPLGNFDRRPAISFDPPMQQT